MKNKKHVHVYILLEHAYNETAAKVHGVYTTKDDAMVALERISCNREIGYMCILKKALKGNPLMLIKHSFGVLWGVR